jgi:hypothetical protein
MVERGIEAERHMMIAINEIRRKSIPTMGIALFFIFCGVNPLVHGRAVCAGKSSSQRISRLRAESDGITPGALFVVIGETECRLSEIVLKAWILSGGKQVVFSTPGGAGGYENEGQSLHIYDLASDSERVVLSEYFAITGVIAVRTHAGQDALIVEMRDGGLGASHIAIVDPNRGEVFVEQKARVVSRKGDILTLGYFHDEEWELLARGEIVRPYRTKSYNINVLLKGKPIVREPGP